MTPELEERAVIALERIASALEAQNVAMADGQQAAVAAAAQLGEDLARSGRRPIIIGELPSGSARRPSVCMMCGGPVDSLGLCPKCLPESQRPPELRTGTVAG